MAILEEMASPLKDDQLHAGIFPQLVWDIDLQRDLPPLGKCGMYIRGTIRRYKENPHPGRDEELVNHFMDVLRRGIVA